MIRDEARTIYSYAFIYGFNKGPVIIVAAFFFITGVGLK